MLLIDNLKQLFEKKNHLYLILVTWLLVGIIVITFLPLAGIIIFLPYLGFLLFLYLLSIVSKKDIRDFSPLSLIGLLIISIPIMVIIIIVLFILFAASLISYIFLTSWFILYLFILLSKKADSSLKKKKLQPLTRGVEFFGGFIFSIILLFVFFLAPSLDIYDIIFEIKFPIYLNYFYFIVGVAVIFLYIICLVFIYQKSFNAWFGLFSILITIYTFYLILNIFLGITGLNSPSRSNLLNEIGLLLADLFIIIYSISTLLGRKAELLVNQLKYFGIDTIFIWLLFSKASYEFVKNYPYGIFSSYFINPFGSYELINFLNSDIIIVVKNIAVLIFFIILIIIIGLWEIRKYNRSIFSGKTNEKSDISIFSFNNQEQINYVEAEDLDANGENEKI